MKKSKSILLTFCMVIIAALCFIGIADAAKGGGGCKDRDNDGYFQKAGCGTAVDCDDADAAVYPGAAEVCDDNIDNNCDGSVDEGCGGCTDNDGDGYGVNGDPACPGGTDLDCDDNDSSVYPGAFTGICDGKDTNCDGIVDAIDRDDDGNGIPDCKICNDTPASLLGPEVCDGYDNDCDDLIDEGDDQDGDGFDTTCGGDCDDNDAAVNPGASEVCDDGVDNNCDGTVDEGCTGCVPTASKERDCDCFDNTDNDCDGSIDSLDRDCKRQTCDTCFDDDGDGWFTCGNDCDDSDPAINPGATEVCNGIDDNCDGLLPIEEQDADVDGVSICEGDCDDNNPNRSPNNTEGPFGDPTCGDALDNDCDDLTDASDPDCADPCIDNDADGYSPVGGSCGPVDCDDNNPNRSPGEQEGPFGYASCSDGFDNDCDELIDSADQDCAYTCTDNDGDGYGNPGDPTCLNGSALDCNDTDPNIHPDADDSNCNGVDDNCSGTEDDGYVPTPTFCGVGECASTGVLECISGILVDNCVPGSPAIEGPLGSPTCSGGLDEDCDALIDGADPGCQSTCLDEDGDGYGYYGDSFCPNPGVDCNDNDPNINPGASEVCNGIDDNCDGLLPIDEQDVDGDGVSICEGDCDDNNPSRSPDEEEGPFGSPSCSDGLDNDCDELVDSADTDCLAPCPDNDGDGSVLCDGACDPAGLPCDCNDNNPNESPGNTEGPSGDPTCSDTLDNDCDNRTDLSDSGCCTDIDGDGYSSEGGPCGPVDCDDFNPNRSPGEQEGPFGSSTCVDGFDNDCDELVDSADQDCAYTCTDLDGDGYGNPGDPACPNGSAEDCDDNNLNISPGASEGPYDHFYCCDTADNDCDGQIDESDPGCQDGGGQAAVCEFKMIDLGTLGGAISHAYGINDNGQVVGYSETVSGDTHAFLYENGAMTDLGTISSIGTTEAHDINNIGQIVGFSGGQSFLYENGTMTDIGAVIAPFGGSYAYGINDNSQIVGQEFYNGNGFLYENGSTTNLGNLGGVSGSSAEDININGQIAGFSSISTGEWHAFLYESGVMTDLGTLGGTISYAWGINDVGQIVGISRDAGNEEHAFLYEGGSMTDLSILTGTVWSAYDINNSSQIVGAYLINSTSQACIYENGTLKGLDVGAGGSAAEAINNNGLIVGYRGSAGNYRAKMWAFDKDNDTYYAHEDCDDTDPLVFPGAPLLCDAKDNNCDGFQDFLTDEDKDGDGVPWCASDCDDNDPNRYPGATYDDNPMFCYDGIDNDCDLIGDSADPDECPPSNDCPDVDGDGYPECNGSCDPRGMLCDCDSDPAINPGADDSNCNGVDDDCDGIPDDDYLPSPVACGIGECASTGLLDCVDGVEVDTCVPFPPAPEGPIGHPTCYDGLDNDCDAFVDIADTDCIDSCTIDNDGDGFTICDGDCDDNDPNVCPICPLLCDGKDNNCDGHQDVPDDVDSDGDGVPLCAGDCDDTNPMACCDADGDGYGILGGTVCSNGMELDCDDGDPNVNPGATEGPLGDPTCSDIKDNDCDGLTDNADANCM